MSDLLRKAGFEAGSITVEVLVAGAFAHLEMRDNRVVPVTIQIQSVALCELAEALEGMAAFLRRADGEAPEPTGDRT